MQHCTHLKLQGSAGNVTLDLEDLQKNHTSYGSPEQPVSTWNRSSCNMLTALLLDMDQYALSK